MNLPMQTCAVCNKPTSLFNYGAQSCNACKTFFRRSSVCESFPERCVNGGKCTNCRFCRYQVCLSAGMSWKSPSRKTINIAGVIELLLAMDSHREHVFLNYTVTENLGVDEIIFSNSIQLTQNSPDFKPTFYDWGCANQTTSINFMKKFEFFNQLSFSEMRSFIKNTYMSHVMFCNSMRSFLSNKEAAEFPGGVDVFPDEIKYVFKDSPAVLNKVRCPLIARLRELRITNEEFLLLSAIMICNPGSSSFSESTRELISGNQRKYSTALFKYCQNTYQRFGPTRYTDLLSLCHLINKTFLDFGHILVLLVSSAPHGAPDPRIKKGFIDLLALIMK